MRNESATLDLYSMKQVEFLLGRPRSDLKDLSRHATRYYEPFPLNPGRRWFARDIKPAKKRLIDHPIDPLKAIQSRVQERLLSRLVLPEHLLGGVRGKSIVDNAKLHLGAPFLVTIDIKNFFPSITPAQVSEVFRRVLNCSPEISYLLTGLTTCRGRLPPRSAHQSFVGESCPEQLRWRNSVRLRTEQYPIFQLDRRSCILREVGLGHR